LLSLIYPWLLNRCLAINNSSLLVSADMSHVPVSWQRSVWNIHISSDISALWAECHISPCLYSSLYLYNQVKKGNETIPFTERQLCRNIHTYIHFYIDTLADSPALPRHLFVPRSIVTVDISVVTEPLPSYQQFFIVGFRRYELCTRCLATAKLQNTYLLRYFGPLGRIPRFSLLILFLILIQSGKRGKWNYTIHRKKVCRNIHTYIHTFTFI
jgi:hypothetical protein